MPNLPFPGRLTPPPVPATGIRWSDDYLFTTPQLLSQFTLISETQGIYAILAPSDDWTPKKLRPIYFGEAGQLKRRVCLSHEKYFEWKREAGTQDLYVSFYLTLGKSDAQRKAIEEFLIGKYNPPCNVKSNPLAGLGYLIAQNMGRKL